MEQDHFSLGFQCFIIALENELSRLDVLITEIVDPEGMEPVRGVCHLEIAEMLLHVLLQSVQLHKNPAVNQIASLEVDGTFFKGNAFEMQGHELVRLPDLVTEVSVADDPFQVQVDGSGLGQVAKQGETQRISAAFRDPGWEFRFFFFQGTALLAFLQIAFQDFVLKGFQGASVNNFQRINNVAQGFGHFTALRVSDNRVEKHGLERQFTAQEFGEHGHTGDPEEQDITARL